MATLSHRFQQSRSQDGSCSICGNLLPHPLHSEELRLKQAYSDEQLAKHLGVGKSRAVPRLELIPYEGLCEVAKIYEKGLANYGDGAYNALGCTRSLQDRKWLIDRLSHVIHHAYAAIRKIHGADSNGDWTADAAAIGWGGLTVAQAGYEHFKQPKANPGLAEKLSQCGGVVQGGVIGAIKHDAGEDR